MKTFKQYLILLAVIPLLGYLLIAAKSKEPTVYGVGFYNVENLFDTIHDVNKNDHDYLIGGKLDWNREKYSSKLTNIARVLSEMGSDKTPAGPAVIGLAEIENFRVLLDLILQPALKVNTNTYTTKEKINVVLTVPCFITPIYFYPNIVCLFLLNP